jgi:pyruvate/2-oxoglutarate dehydrogenase complex dihydrolipoamide acyltransferase (E2) component
LTFSIITATPLTSLAVCWNLIFTMQLTSHASDPHYHATFNSTRTDAASITPTGRGGRLTKGDVATALAGGTAQKVDAVTAATVAVAIGASTAVPLSSMADTVFYSPSSRRERSHVDTPNSNMRKVIAARLTESKTTVPHSYAAEKCCMDPLLKLRATMKSTAVAAAAATGNKGRVSVPSVNDFVIRASAHALRDTPRVNAVWNAQKGEAEELPTVDISVAVATDGGLITPIITDAVGKSIVEVQASMRDLAGRARLNKLAPHEFVGGSFTISNLGMFGISEFSAVINPPQAAILAVGGSQNVLGGGVDAGISDEDDMLKQDLRVGGFPPVAEATMMSVTLSFDERVIDAFIAARFLKRVRYYMERPDLCV